MRGIDIYYIPIVLKLVRFQFNTYSLFKNTGYSLCKIRNVDLLHDLFYSCAKKNKRGRDVLLKLVYISRKTKCQLSTHGDYMHCLTPFDGLHSTPTATAKKIC